MQTKNDIHKEVGEMGLNMTIPKVALLFILFTVISYPTAKSENSGSFKAQKAPKVIIPKEKITLESFKEYMIVPKPFPKASKLQLKKNSSSWEFRTYFKEAFKEEADFAGKYKVVQWGCGSGCQVNSLINLETGEIITGFISSMGVLYGLNSSVFITDPFMEEEFLNGRPTIYGTAKIYHFDGTKFNLIREQGSETE